jgi:hypothetical protein
MLEQLTFNTASKEEKYICLQQYFLEMAANS